MSLNVSYLRDMLAQDSDAIRQLKELLTRERQQLEQRELEGMQDIVSRKDHLLEIISFNAKQRDQLMQAAGVAQTFEGWEQLLLRDPSTRSLIPGWQSLTKEFVECQKANEINGKMINRSKQTLNHLLNLIRGQVAAPSLYTQKGATTNQSASHTVVKA